MTSPPAPADIDRSAVFGLRHGAYDYLRKPFSVSEVQQVVHRVLRDRGQLGLREERPAGLPVGAMLRHVAVQGLFRIEELALRGVEAGAFVETALDYVVQSLASDGVLILLRDDLGDVTQRQKGNPGLVNQLLGLLSSRPRASPGTTPVAGGSSGSLRRAGR
ncbi:MAG: hypothetical protein HYV62_05885 [Candidatus Rokubacteria bacterium]|nr:hypothetical protein [Candidatus Rokubacteria bacterium]